MVRRIFYSFHYERDNWRAATVRNIGTVEGNPPASDNDWEKVKGGGDAAVRRWIASQMRNRTCTVVLVGSSTAGRKWINYEIIKSWERGMGVLGIHIHGLKNSDGKTSKEGKNPFDCIVFNDSGKTLSSVVECYEPRGRNSQERYESIKKDLASVVEKAIQVRSDL